MIQQGRLAGAGRRCAAFLFSRKSIYALVVVSLLCVYGHLLFIYEPITRFVLGRFALDSWIVWLHLKLFQWVFWPYFTLEWMFPHTFYPGWSGIASSHRPSYLGTRLLMGSLILCTSFWWLCVETAMAVIEWLWRRLPLHGDRLEVR